jgi:hypothetical protein
MGNIFFLICIVGGGVQTGSARHVGHSLAYCTCPGLLWGWRIWWNEWQGKPKYSEKTCPDATLSTKNPTWPDQGLNPGRRGGKPATNRFSYGASHMGNKFMQYLCMKLEEKRSHVGLWPTLESNIGINLLSNWVWDCEYDSPDVRLCWIPNGLCGSIKRDTFLDQLTYY